MDSYTEDYSVRIVREQHTDRLISIAFYDDPGRLHRTGDEPAFVEYDPATGRPIYLHFAIHGSEHREGGRPSLQQIDRYTGVTWYERWLENDAPRENGVVVVERDPRTGRVISIIRSENGEEVEEALQGDAMLDSRPSEP